MNDGNYLPNLLDDHINPSQTQGLMEGLHRVRRDAFDVWTSRCRSNRLHKTIQQTLDNAIILALVVEYLRRTKPKAMRVREIGELVTETCISDMAHMVEPKRSPAWARLSNSLNGTLPIPFNVRKLLFGQLLPDLYATFQNELPVTALGDYHQMCLAVPLTDRGTHDERRTKGAHYTPASLVDYMIVRAMEQLRGEGTARDTIRILDPSCGCGAFLVAVLRYIETFRDSKQTAILHGSDIDARAVSLTSLSLIVAALTSRITDRSALAGTIVRNRNLKVQDFLADNAWANQTFDLIIGGPPFIRVEQMHRTFPDRVREYRKMYATAQDGQFDLYMPFIEKSINLLRPGGCLAFSVSNGFLRNKSGARLRRFLTDHCAVEEIVEFEDDNIYPDASVQIALLLARKTKSLTRTRYAFVPTKRPVREQLRQLCRPSCRSVSGSKVLRISLPKDSIGAWPLHSSDDDAFLEHMDRIGTALGKLPVYVSLGLCTGTDDVFIFRPAGRTANGVARVVTRNGLHLDLESAVLKPVRRTRQSAAVSNENPEHVCVFPYAKNGDVLDEQTFREMFPMAYEYLATHKQRLRSRRLCPDQPWYALRKADVASHIGKAKVFTPTACAARGFTFDAIGTLCHHSLLTITPLNPTIDPHYLLGVLNSKHLWRYITLRCARLGSDRRVLRLQIAKRLPIVLPQTRPQRTLATQIARQCRRLGPKAPVDDLVKELYAV